VFLVPSNLPRVYSAGMLGTLFGLFFAHRKQRDQEREKRLQYWREQVKLPFSHASSSLTINSECFPSESLANERNRPRVNPVVARKRE
jgi:hypothetical protein